jgi:hypothetical protein
MVHVTLFDPVNRDDVSFRRVSMIMTQATIVDFSRHQLQTGPWVHYNPGLSPGIVHSNIQIDASCV